MQQINVGWGVPRPTFGLNLSVTNIYQIGISHQLSVISYHQPTVPISPRLSPIPHSPNSLSPLTPDP